MINGWVEVTKYGVDPNWKQGDPWHKRNIQIPTGKQRCPDCVFTTDVDDMMGVHTCPELRDSDDNIYTIGDEVYFYASSRIKRGTITRYNITTGKMTVQEHSDKATKHVLNSTRKALRMSNANEE